MPIVLKRIFFFVLVCGWTQVALCQKTAAVSAETQQHIKDVETGLMPSVVVKDDPHPKHSMSERMAALHVNGVSVAVIHHGAIEWAQGFGVVSVGGAPVMRRLCFRRARSASRWPRWPHCGWCRRGSYRWMLM